MRGGMLTFRVAHRRDVHALTMPPSTTIGELRATLAPLTQARTHLHHTTSHNGPNGDNLKYCASGTLPHSRRTPNRARASASTVWGVTQQHIHGLITSGHASYYCWFGDC